MDSLKLYVKLGIVFLVITSGISKSYADFHADAPATPAATPAAGRTASTDITFASLNDLKKLQEVLGNDVTVPTKYTAPKLAILTEKKTADVSVKKDEVKEPLEKIIAWRASQEVCRNDGNQSSSRITDPLDKMLLVFHRAVTEKDPITSKWVGLDQNTVVNLWTEFTHYLKAKIKADETKTDPDATVEQKKQAKEADTEMLNMVTKFVKQFVSDDKLKAKLDPSKEITPAMLTAAETQLKKRDQMEKEYTSTVDDFNKALAMLTDGSSKKICVADMKKADTSTPPSAGSNPTLATGTGAGTPPAAGTKPTQAPSQVTDFAGKPKEPPTGTGGGAGTGAGGAGGETATGGAGGDGQVAGTGNEGDPNAQNQAFNQGNNGLNNDDLAANQLAEQRRLLEDEIRRLQGELAVAQNRNNNNDQGLADALRAAIGAAGDRSVTENPPVVQSPTQPPQISGGQGGGTPTAALTPPTAPTDPGAGAGSPGAGVPTPTPTPAIGGPIPPQLANNGQSQPEYKQPVVVNVPKSDTTSALLQELRDERADRIEAYQMAMASRRPNVNNNTRAQAFASLPPRRPMVPTNYMGRPSTGAVSGSGIYRGLRGGKFSGTGPVSGQFNTPFNINLSPQ